MKLITIVYIFILIIIIYIAYLMGWSNGMIYGSALAQISHNETFCDLLITNTSGVYIDTNGDCVLKDDAKYNQRLECPFGNMSIKGEKDLGTFGKIMSFPQDVIMYPILTCDLLHRWR